MVSKVMNLKEETGGTYSRNCSTRETKKIGCDKQERKNKKDGYDTAVQQYQRRKGRMRWKRRKGRMRWKRRKGRTRWISDTHAHVWRSLRLGLREGTLTRSQVVLSYTSFLPGITPSQENKKTKKREETCHTAVRSI